VWSDIAMDFIEGFPKVGGKPVILTIVDWFSKFVHFIPLGHPYSAASDCKAFFDNIIRLHGFLTSIISDQDPVFTATSGRSCFASLERGCTPAPHFTRKLMASLKLLTRASQSI
jgi:hypothetical protein